MISEERLSKIHSALNKIISREAKLTLKLPMVLIIKTASKEEWRILTNAIQIQTFEHEPLKLWEKVFKEAEIERKDIEYVGFLSIGSGIFTITEDKVEKIAAQLKRSPDEIRELVKNPEGMIKRAEELDADLKLVKDLIKEDAGQCIIVLGNRDTIKIYRASIEAKSHVSSQGELIETGFELSPFETLQEINKETHDSDWSANQQISCVFVN